MVASVPEFGDVFITLYRTKHVLTLLVHREKAFNVVLDFTISSLFSLIVLSVESETC